MMVQAQRPGVSELVSEGERLTTRANTDAYGDSLYTPDQIAQIMDFWKQMKANARLIMPSYGNMGDLLASGEIVAGTPGA